MQTTENSTHVTPAELSALLSLHEDDFKLAKRSNAHSIVLERTVSYARDCGATWRDTLAGIEAWYLRRIPTPTAPGSAVVCAALHGLYDGVMVGRINGGDPEAEAVLDAVQGIIGNGDLPNPPDYGPTPADSPLHAVNVIAELAQSAAACMVVEHDGYCPWSEVVGAAQKIAATAYEAGGDELAESLAEAVRVVARKAVRS